MKTQGKGVAMRTWKFEGKAEEQIRNAKDSCVLMSERRRKLSGLDGFIEAAKDELAMRKGAEIRAEFGAPPEPPRYAWVRLILNKSVRFGSHDSRQYYPQFPDGWVEVDFSSGWAIIYDDGPAVDRLLLAKWRAENVEGIEAERLIPEEDDTRSGGQDE